MQCNNKLSELSLDSSIYHTSISLNSTNKLHEIKSDNLSKTSSGKVFEADIKDIFSLLLICLGLKELKLKKTLITKIFSRQFPYSFSIEEALNTMKSMSITIEHSMTSSVISYNIGPDLGLALLNRFYDARLLHSPADRTRNKPKMGVLLQPTSKGVAILQDFCKKHGMKKESCPDILQSNFNSMDLFNFERDLISDKILYSTYFLQLLLSRILGLEPNVWNEKNKPDSVPSLDKRLDIDEWMDFSSFGCLSNYSTKSMKSGFELIKKSSIPDIKNSTFAKKSDDISPFYHRYFSNPESNCHSQYYVSCGVRIFKDKKFINKSGDIITLDYCFTGKALCQWLLDCTDIISIGHAVEVIGLLVQENMITALNSKDKMSLKDRKTYFIIGPAGRNICVWDDIKHHSFNCLNSNYESILPKLSSCTSEEFFDPIITSTNVNTVSGYQNLNLKAVLKDPGMRHVFRKHLENEFCRENLDAYILLTQYNRKIHMLEKILQSTKEYFSKYDNGLNYQIMKLSDTCMSLAYHIYFTYLSSDSPCVLNIEYKLRERVNSILLHQTSTSSDLKSNYNLTPIEESFNSLETDTQSISNSSCSSTLVNLPQLLTFDNEIPNDCNQEYGLKYLDNENISSPLSQNNLVKNLDTLAQLSNVFREVINHTYRLMEIDSFPKFLNSEIFKKSLLNISCLPNL